MPHDTWRPLDLRRRNHSEGPFDGELVALHLEAKTGWPLSKYRIGRFETYERRTIFQEDHGSSWYASKLNERYYVTWCRVPEDKTGKEMF